MKKPLIATALMLACASAAHADVIVVSNFTYLSAGGMVYGTLPSGQVAESSHQHQVSSTNQTYSGAVAHTEGNPAGVGTASTTMSTSGQAQWTLSSGNYLHYNVSGAFAGTVDSSCDGGVCASGFAYGTVYAYLYFNLTDTHSIWGNVAYDPTYGSGGQSELYIFEDGKTDPDQIGGTRVGINFNAFFSGSNLFSLTLGPGSYYIASRTSYSVPGYDYDNQGTGTSSMDLYMAPVPLPAGAWLLMSGVAGVVGAARRRRVVSSQRAQTGVTCAATPRS